MNEFAIGTGVGLRLNLPIGPLRLDLGTPLMERGKF
ncbi:MAG: BamA/TamA family outer membrane protein [Blastochloris sp.]|nr:BamA/TamA family outer membrane protein [Blastochloris sp.]